MGVGTTQTSSKDLGCAESSQERLPENMCKVMVQVSVDWTMDGDEEMLRKNLPKNVE